ncbi:ABC transporter substrate-binding protein [Actinokineospora sp. NBRC 105648]|uniref:ABC transporter substrate-binding protein n=1 Tax=Actinokineospora sp. NBRC 105648 TaxID=3032206 RepID=UPI0024A5AF94|nr:ABC transporter substrate-binding protein [Actinokineospora sp. NBRC 105648]GLZ42752.1 peptide ABC transporter permease [Actinokineospora sp. NBRC 105648]
MPRHALSKITPVIALALLATACGASGATDNTAAAGGAPKPGGTLRLGISSNPDCLDPQQVGTNAALNVGRQLVDSLTDQDPATGKITPWLAEKWEVSPDSTAFTFSLRSGATFADGTPVDAEAVRTNFDAAKKLAAKAPLASSYLAVYKGSTVVDPRTVRVEFSAPSAQFLQASSTMSLGILAPAAYQKTPEQRCQGEGLIGSGPFVFDSFKPNQQIVVSKRKGYAWGSPLWAHQGEAYLDKIEYQVVPEPGVRTGSLASGQLDAITDVQPVDEPQFTAGGFTEPVRPNPGIVFHLTANTTRGVLTDEKVRQAVSKGVNRAEVTDTVLTKNYKAATSILGSKTPLHTDLGKELAYDPDGAKALLDAAGWVPGPDGIRVKDGQRLRAAVLFSAVFNQNQTVLELLQQQLRKIGFDLAIELHTNAETTKLTNAGDYDFLWYNVTRADADILRQMFSTKATNRSKLAPGGELDTVLDQQSATVDEAVRGPAAERAQRIIVEKGYAVPVFELTQVLGVGPKAHGVEFEASSRLRLFDAWVS